ncbi:MAG TPA: hypothetical protein VH394_07030 [Thermoanaerobaculia bacterium]|nr:hypothetical protein [Thermoanaerobaculia bacterium]
MKIQLLIRTVVAALLVAGASNAQLYVPLPPGSYELIFTNTGPKPAVFRQTSYIPSWPPLPLTLETLEAGRTAIDSGGTIGSFMAIEVFKSGWPGLQVGAAIINPDGSAAFRLPVFTSRDVAPRRSLITFQFLPKLQPNEAAALVVLSVEGSTSKCSATLYNDSGEVSNSSFTIVAYEGLAVVELAPTASVTYVRASCSKPSLAYAYRVTPTTTEFILPSVSASPTTSNPAAPAVDDDCGLND